MPKHILITTKCNLCGSAMAYDKYDFYKCPVCDSEFWPKVSFESEKKQLNDAICNDFVSHSLQDGEQIKGGSCSSGRSNRKQKLKKPTPQKMFEKLFKQC